MHDMPFHTTASEVSGYASEVLDNSGAAAFLGVAPSSLEVDRTSRRRWRVPYIKIGRRVMYRRSDLVAYLDSCRVAG